MPSPQMQVEDSMVSAFVWTRVEDYKVVFLKL
jgi:hypothetical protein